MFYFLKQCNIEKVLLSTNISFGKKTINTSLVTCIMIIKLSHYIQCFLKQGLMWKVMVDKANGCISWLKMILIKKNIILSGMKSVLISKKGLVLSLSIIFLKTEIKPHGHEAKRMDEEKAWKDLWNSKLCWTLLILASTITGCISISAFLSLFFLSIRIASSAIRLNIFARTAWINKYISVKAWSNSIVRKSKLNRIEFLTSKVLINSVISMMNLI